MRSTRAFWPSTSQNLKNTIASEKLAFLCEIETYEIDKDQASPILMPFYDERRIFAIAQAGLASIRKKRISIDAEARDATTKGE